MSDPQSSSSSSAPPLPACKRRLPYRLGTTSYIVPADVMTNVTVLAPLVDDIELVLFESDAIAPLPDPATVAHLAARATDHALSYTIHLPLDCDFGHPDPCTRAEAVARARRVVARMAPLAPHAWILHLDDGHAAPDPERWRAACDQALSAFLDGGPPPQRLAIESLAYPLDHIAEVIATHGTAVCLDVGHELAAGRDPLAAFDRWRSRLRVVHLHGVAKGRDHRALDQFDPVMLRALDARMRPFGADLVCTVEVFGQTAYRASMPIMESLSRCPTRPSP